FFQAEDGIRDFHVTGVQTCALPIYAAVQIVDGLLKEENALIVFTHSSRESNRDNDSQYRTRDAENITDLPLIVLVDNGTASAARSEERRVGKAGRARRAPQHHDAVL